MNDADIIDNSEALLKFINTHFVSREMEKIQNGEVFTPFVLINQMLDKLSEIYPGIWSNPCNRFLDPANGFGNYFMVVYSRLMIGLCAIFPDFNERKRHILENMLYMCEINDVNNNLCAMLFNTQNKYKLNLFRGDFLQLNIQEPFDIIVGNPPYQPPSNGKRGGKSLWPLFVEKCICNLKKGGHIAVVHPALWRKPENILHDLMFSLQFYYISIHTGKEGAVTFNAATRYDWYVAKKPQFNVHIPTPTIIHTDVQTTEHLTISTGLPFIANHGNNIIEKIIKFNQHDTLGIGFINTILSCEGHLQREFISKTKSVKYKYPIFNSSSKRNGIELYWSSKPLKHQYIQKVIFSNGGIIQPIYDPGQLGTTQGGIFIEVSCETNGYKMVRFLKSKLMNYIVSATKWSNYETVRQLFWVIPNPYKLSENFTDEQVYAYFRLTPCEILQIETYMPTGLDTFIPLTLGRS